jgi:hypothetical protein
MTAVEFAVIAAFTVAISMFDFGTAATVITGAGLITALTVVTAAVLARSRPA